MASGYSSHNPDDGRSPRARRSAQMEEAELLVPPEAAPAQLSRSMFSPPSSRSPAPAPLTNQHLARVSRLDAAARGHGGGGGGGRGGRPPRSEAATSVRGGRGGFSVVSDEEQIEVDGEPTTLADDDMEPPPHPTGLGESGLAGLGYGPDGRPVYGNGYNGYNNGHSNGHGGGGAYGGAYGGGGGGPDPLEELEADTPLVRLYEVQSDLEAEGQGAKDPWTMVHLAQLALGHAKVVWRTMPVAVREEPLLLAKAHFGLARAYQGHKCDKQAAEHGKEALAAIPAEVADTEAAAALRTEVQVMRAEALLSAAAAPGVAADSAAGLARKALNQLVKAAGLRPPVAFTPEEVEDVENGHSDRSTIDEVTDMGIVALMAQCQGVVAESRLRAADAERLDKQSSLRSADDTAARADRRTDRGDAFYSAEQLERWRLQERHFRDEADAHEAEAVRLAGEAERAYDSAMYCLNHVIDVEGRRLEDVVGRDRKTEHPTFRSLWCRSLDFMAGMAEAYGYQGKVSGQLQMVDEVLSAFAQYGGGGWLPVARHVRALKDKGALLVAQRQYDKAVHCYEQLEALVHALYPSAAEGGSPGDVLRREVQGAEVLKLRGDVALASGDFRTAQHLFSQALEAYQRHLGVHAGVARDLLHRMDEVKAYLADSRVMGRMASFGGGGGGGPGGGRGGSGGGSSPPTPKGGGGGGLAAAAARSPAASRSPLTLPPGGGGGGGGRPGSSLSLHSHSHGHLGPGRASAGGLYALDEDGVGLGGGGGSGSGGGGMGSTVSSAGASTIPALSPGHRLPHLNTLAPNGGARPGRASLHEFDD